MCIYIMYKHIMVQASNPPAVMVMVTGQYVGCV